MGIGALSVSVFGLYSVAVGKAYVAAASESSVAANASDDTVGQVVQAWEILGPLGFIVVAFLGLLAYCVVTWTKRENKKADAEIEMDRKREEREAAHETWLQTHLTNIIAANTSAMSEHAASTHRSTVVMERVERTLDRLEGSRT